MESCCQPLFQKYLYVIADILPDRLAKLFLYG